MKEFFINFGINTAINLAVKLYKKNGADEITRNYPARFKERQFGAWLK